MWLFCYVDHIFCVFVYVWYILIYVYILIVSISFFSLHFLCAELGYLFFWMMQWVNKIVYQEGNLLRYKDLDTTVGFGLIKQMEFHASGKLWRRTPIAHTTSVNKVSLRWKMTGWCLHLTFYQQFSAALRLHVKNPGFRTIRKSDVFVCKMFKLLTIREESGWLPGTFLSKSNSFMNM